MNRDFLEMIKTRRSTRSFKPDSVPEDLLDAVLEAGTYAPTGMNRQSPVIIAVSDKKYREKLSKLNAAIMGVDKDPYYGAPTVVLVLADPSANTFVEDGSCVLENLMLAAHACDLGSVWVHREREIFDSEEGKKVTARVESARNPARSRLDSHRLSRRRTNCASPAQGRIYSKDLNNTKRNCRAQFLQSVEKVCHCTDSRLPCVRGAVTAKP